MKLLAAVVETFGIYSASSFASEDSAKNISVLNEDTAYGQVTYTSLEKMLSKVGGYRIIPDWVAEGFNFVQGNIYEDMDMAHCLVSYEYINNSLGVNIYMHLNDEAAAGFEYERTLSEFRNEEVTDLSISYYHNFEDGEFISASWIAGKALFKFRAILPLNN